jgi:hypothetical protein
MAKGILQHIVEVFKSRKSEVFLIENNDLFLYRKDVISALHAFGINVHQGTPIEQRIKFETRENEELLFFLSQDNSNYLEDIQRQSISVEFRLSDYLRGYHIPSLIQLELPVLDECFLNPQIVNLNRQETINLVGQLQNQIKSREDSVDLEDFIHDIEALMKEAQVNWLVVCRLISKAMVKAIGKPEMEILMNQINEVNKVFQKNLESNYPQTKNSSAVKKPKIVSKILDYLSFNYPQDKVALVVIDGLAFWQYELLSKKLPGYKEEQVIYSWIPSITQLSRQAIFRGGNPVSNYRQGPVSEEKLWRDYWKARGVNEFQIGYQHEKIDFSNLNPITKLAVVFKDLDDKMHSSTDYTDLLVLTKNWIERSKIQEVIHDLVKNGFSVFITSDHGNIQSKAWRGLKGWEKLGTNKSGSRSERHLEYSESWLTKEFLENNPELHDSVVSDDQAIYFKNDLSFSNRDILVTHGGAHLLEVLIPFIEIKDEA